MISQKFITASKNVVYPTANLVQNLNPFEHDKLIRYRGRIDQADLPFYKKKNFLLLSMQHYLTKLLILNANHITLQGGVQKTLCKIRETFGSLEAVKS